LSYAGCRLADLNGRARWGSRWHFSNSWASTSPFSGWGPAAVKRQGLLASLPTGSAPKGSVIPVYEPVKPSQENRWRLAPRVIEGGFESWPGLDEIFPVNFQAVNPSRSLDGTVIGTKRSSLEERMKAYFGASKFADVVRIFPKFGVKRANYKPEPVWKDMRELGYERSRIHAYLTFPFDMRWIYYSQHPHFLDRHSPDFARNRTSNEFFVTVPEPRKTTETIPVYSTTLVGLHVHERGSVVFPRETRGVDLLADHDANIPEASWRVLRDHFGHKGERRDDSARAFVGRLFRVAFAVLHAPRYQAEHNPLGAYTSELSDAAIRPPRGFVGAIDLAIEVRLADDTVADRLSLHLTWVEAPKTTTEIAAAQATAVAPPVGTGSTGIPPRETPNSQATSAPLRPLDRDEIAGLRKRGEEFMAAGNVGLARMALQRAAEAGDPQAAFALATKAWLTSIAASQQMTHQPKLETIICIWRRITARWLRPWS
jgi:hypothetical protein